VNTITGKKDVGVNRMNFSYKNYINSPEWYDKRQLILDRCNNKCEVCHNKKVIHIHHITYERLGNELLEDLQGLCLECHQKLHPDKKLKREWLLITKLCKKCNISLSELHKILIKNKLLEKIKKSTCHYYGSLENKKIISKIFYKPTDLAENLEYSKRKSRVKSKGDRGPWVWNYDMIMELLIKHNKK